MTTVSIKVPLPTDGTCIVEGCNRKKYKSSFCSPCAKSFAPTTDSSKDRCSHNDCNSKPFVGGLCLFHHRLSQPEQSRYALRIGSSLDSYVHLFGRVTDKHIASLASVSIRAVAAYRKRHGLPRGKKEYEQRPERYSCSYHDLLGILPDTIIAKAFGITHPAVSQARRCRNIPVVNLVESRYLCLNFPFDMTPEGVAQFLAEYNGNE